MLQAISGTEICVDGGNDQAQEEFVSSIPTGQRRCGTQ
jgi:hypothetical protein